jgi:hypothetical protein
MNSEFNRHEPGFNVLHKVSENVYTFLTPFLFSGVAPINNRSVVAHIPAGEGQARGTLVIINPAQLTPEIERDLLRLSEETSSVVRYLISPGDWHYLFIGQHLKAFPEARAYVPPGRIPSKKPNFEYTLIDVDADNPFPELSPHLVAFNFKGLLDFADPAGKLSRYELVFLLPAVRAITSGDVFYYNGGEELHPMQKSLGQVLHTLDFHFAKWRMVKNAEALERSLGRILEWDFDRYISIHGQPGNMLEQGAKAHVEKVLSWAKAPPPDFVSLADKDKPGGPRSPTPSAKG